MPIVEVVKGNMFDARPSAVVVPVNCVGAMGAGLAKLFARMFKLASAKYRTQCSRGEMRIGSVFAPHATPDLVAAGIQWAIFFPTKDRWEFPSELDWIRQGLEAMVALFDPEIGGLDPIDTLAIPALGCGWGELAFDDVRPLIEAAAQRMITVERVKIFEPHEMPRGRR